MTISNKNKIFHVIFVFLLLAADLIFLYYTKYQNQDIPFSEFRINTIGNLLNLLFLLALFSGIVVCIIRRRFNFNSKILVFWTVLITISLIAAFISTKIQLPFSNIYLFNHSFNKVIIAGLFLLFQMLLTAFLVFVWVSSSNRKELITIRTMLNSFTLFLGLLVFAFIYSNVSRWDIEKIEKTSKKSVGVVLGAAVWSENQLSPSFEKRVNKAVKLYYRGIISKIQLTGSNAPGELSEAQAAYVYLKRKNIDSSDIWMEETTTSTTEQIHFIKNNLVNKKGIRHIIIISDAFHLTRVSEICDFYNMEIQVAASDFTLTTSDRIYNNLRESIALTLFWLFAL